MCTFYFTSQILFPRECLKLTTQGTACFPDSVLFQGQKKTMKSFPRLFPVITITATKVVLMLRCKLR